MNAVNEPAPAPEPIAPVSAETISTDDDEDTMSYFSRLANED